MTGKIGTVFLIVKKYWRHTQNLKKSLKSEIERAESQKRQEAIKKTQRTADRRTKAQKENERRKYFLGGVVLKHSQFLKTIIRLVPKIQKKRFCIILLEDFIVCSYLSEM